MLPQNAGCVLEAGVLSTANTVLVYYLVEVFSKSVISLITMDQIPRTSQHVHENQI